MMSLQQLPPTKQCDKPPTFTGEIKNRKENGLQHKHNYNHSGLQKYFVFRSIQSQTPKRGHNKSTDPYTLRKDFCGIINLCPDSSLIP